MAFQLTLTPDNGPLLHQLHWLQVHHRIDYKLAVMTYKNHRSSTPVYLSRHIKLCQSACSLRSSDIPLLDKPASRREFAKRSFLYSALSVRNSLPTQIVNSNSLTTFKSRLKSLLLTIGHLLLPALDFGTVYLLTSGLPHHSQHFIES